MASCKPQTIKGQPRKDWLTFIAPLSLLTGFQTASHSSKSMAPWWPHPTQAPFTTPDCNVSTCPCALLATPLQPIRVLLPPYPGLAMAMRNVTSLFSAVMGNPVSVDTPLGRAYLEVRTHPAPPFQPPDIHECVQWQRTMSYKHGATNMEYNELEHVRIDCVPSPCACRNWVPVWATLKYLRSPTRLGWGRLQ